LLPTLLVNGIHAVNKVTNRYFRELFIKIIFKGGLIRSWVSPHRARKKTAYENGAKYPQTHDGKLPNKF
jgi:hypothetical protein